MPHNVYHALHFGDHATPTAVLGAAAPITAGGIAQLANVPGSTYLAALSIVLSAVVPITVSIIQSRARATAARESAAAAERHASKAFNEFEIDRLNRSIVERENRIAELQHRLTEASLRNAYTDPRPRPPQVNEGGSHAGTNTEGE